MKPKNAANFAFFPVPQEQHHHGLTFEFAHFMHRPGIRGEHQRNARGGGGSVLSNELSHSSSRTRSISDLNPARLPRGRAAAAALREFNKCARDLTNGILRTILGDDHHPPRGLGISSVSLPPLGSSSPAEAEILLSNCNNIRAIYFQRENSIRWPKGRQVAVSLVPGLKV